MQSVVLAFAPTVILTPLLIVPGILHALLVGEKSPGQALTVMSREDKISVAANPIEPTLKVSDPLDGAVKRIAPAARSEADAAIKR